MENFNGLNFSTASDVKLGSDDVQSVYLGSKLIWSRLGFQDYFTVKAVEQGYIYILTGKYPTIGAKRNYDGITNSYGINAPVDDIYYSINNGSWQRVQVNFHNVNSENFNFNVTINVAKDDIIKIKSISLTDKYFPIRINSSKKIELSGNIMSLVYGDDFENNCCIKYPDYFAYLFYSTQCVSAKDLIFPQFYSETAYDCFAFMFANCFYLTELPTFRIAYAPDGAFARLNEYTQATEITLFIKTWNDSTVNSEYTFWFEGNRKSLYTFDKDKSGTCDDYLIIRYDDGVPVYDFSTVREKEFWTVNPSTGKMIYDWYSNKTFPPRNFRIKVGKTRYKTQETALYDLLSSKSFQDSMKEKYQVTLLNEYA